MIVALPLFGLSAIALATWILLLSIVLLSEPDEPLKPDGQHHGRYLSSLRARGACAQISLAGKRGGE
jgi:hypothetical protein